MHAKDKCVSARTCECMVSPSLMNPASLCLQLRVIRAFKSTLEDLEERRSVHSLHSLHSLRSSRSHTGPWPPRPLSDITYIDEDASKALPQSASHNSSLPLKSDAERSAEHTGRLLSPYSAYYLPPSQARPTSPSQTKHATASATTAGTISAASPFDLNNPLSRPPVHETRI